MPRVFDFLRSDDLPPMARRIYAAELPQITLWGTVVGATDGIMAGIVASKTFHASEAATTLIWALPIMMNVLNPVWGVLLRGRRRLHTLAILCLCGLVGVCSISLTSSHWQHAAWIFAIQVGFIHLFLSGIVTLRTTMWRVNYPTTHRARIAGRLQAVRLLLSLITGATLSRLFDWQASAYQIVYPLVTVVGLFSLWPLVHMRVRGEKRDLRRIQLRREADRQANGGRSSTLWAGLREAVGILRHDQRFAQYMVAQFLLGAANFFTEPLLINALTKQFKFAYFPAMLISSIIPNTVSLLTLQYWAPLFDRVGVLRFRISNSLMWVLSYVGVTIAMLIAGLGGTPAVPLAIAVLVIARIFNGLGNSGGSIAWNIGHLHFAPHDQTELYMGIHVGLTGVRGLLMPFVGLACSRVLGYGSFGVALALALVSLVLFHRLVNLDRQNPAAPQSGTGPDNPPRI